MSSQNNDILESGSESSFQTLDDNKPTLVEEEKTFIREYLNLGNKQKKYAYALGQSLKERGVVPESITYEDFVKNKDYMEMISNEMMAQLPDSKEHSLYGGEFDLSDFELIQETNGSISEKMHTKPEWKGKDAAFALKILAARANLTKWFNRQRNQLILFFNYPNTPKPPKEIKTKSQIISKNGVLKKKLVSDNICSFS